MRRIEEAFRPEARSPCSPRASEASSPGRPGRRRALRPKEALVRLLCLPQSPHGAVDQDLESLLTHWMPKRLPRPQTAPLREVGVDPAALTPSLEEERRHEGKRDRLSKGVRSKSRPRSNRARSPARSARPGPRVLLRMEGLPRQLAGLARQAEWLGSTMQQVESEQAERTGHNACPFVLSLTTTHRILPWECLRRKTGLVSLFGDQKGCECPAGPLRSMG